MAATNTATLKLNTGASIPMVALGTWEAADGECAKQVEFALKNGYRHIDTATMYQNEHEVGQGIKASGVPREEIFLTTKLPNTGHKDVQGALDESLKQLDAGYIDLYLMHWPCPVDADNHLLKDHTYIDTYKAMQKLLDGGKVKAIGVSNFTKTKLQRLLADPEVTVVPAVNQIEGHPLLPQHELTKWIQDQGIVVESYCPLGSSRHNMTAHPKVAEIAEKNGVDAGQVLISWAVQRRCVVLPKSIKEHRMVSNLKTLTLSDEDFAALNKIAEVEGSKRSVPGNDFGPKSVFDDEDEN